MTTVPVLERISDYVGYYAERSPDTPAFIQPGATWTYGELAGQVDRFARALLSAGVRKGDRVAIMATPRGECFIGFLAASMIGGITLGLNPKFPLEELRYFVGDAEPKVLIGFAEDAEGPHADVLVALGNEHRCIERTVILGDSAESLVTSWNDWLAQGDGVPDEQLAHARNTVETLDPALIVYTSGSTGRPKGAVLPHRGLAYCSAIQGDYWGTDPMKMLVNLPVNHIGYMGDMCSSVLVNGGTSYFMEKFDPEGMLQLIERERLTCWGQVPTMFQMALGHPNYAKYDLSSLQLIVWGGACAPRELIQALGATGARLATSFGMTETTGSVTYTSRDADLEELADTIGSPDPRFEVRIAHPDGTPVRPGEEGEIQVRGDFIMREYWRRPEATAETIDAEGWLHTQDVALLRPDGKYTIRGRLSQMYKSGGENVYPREVELVLEHHPAVAMAAVFGVPDPLYSEVGHAYLIRMPGSDPTEEELKAFCKEHLVNFKVPKSITIADELPMLPVGKIDKVTLRTQALAQLESGAEA